MEFDDFDSQLTELSSFLSAKQKTSSSSLWKELSQDVSQNFSELETLSDSLRQLKRAFRKLQDRESCVTCLKKNT